MLELVDLLIQIAEKDKQIHLLEKRTEDLENYTRMNEIIITGLKVKPRLYTYENGGNPVSRI